MDFGEGTVIVGVAGGVSEMESILPSCFLTVAKQNVNNTSSSHIFVNNTLSSHIFVNNTPSSHIFVNNTPSSHIFVNNTPSSHIFV